MKTERLVTVRSLTYAYLTMGLFQFAVCFMTFLWVYGDVRSLPPYVVELSLVVEAAIFSGGCNSVYPACDHVLLHRWASRSRSYSTRLTHSPPTSPAPPR